MNVSNFSVEQLAGQRLMVGFEGTGLSDDLKLYIRDLKVGGIILFSQNISTPEQIRQLCSDAQAYAAQCGQPSLFVSVDQEGGQVARLKPPFTQFPGNPAMKGPADARHFARVTAAELDRVGINMNMAPVLDIAFEGQKSIMAKRAFGRRPEWVATMGGSVIDTLQQHGVMAVAKHFPGIGRTTLDSHQDMPTLSVDQSVFEKTDLVPFETAISNRAAGIMLSHIFYPELDPEWPASLSSQIAKLLLRDRMGFNGLVLTDDLDMGAIRKHFDIRTAVVRILDADIDIALICHQGPDIETAFEVMAQKIRKSPSLAQRGIDSAGRILDAKKRYLT